ncbi:putative periplasmic serine endoprotease DegP-like precursor [Botrimarina colliarenosi]|uniref:Putative periplasmic serine endoprotease DegP-like n=1 Tax=Botrimarina colliarenosi TaxID=2528001 RepID=A0A5C6A7V2_9BACT|nr:trypsin-like peptidase domain-containing protein [Botrimarina colliarenosi]TWT96092.1 putative periplasmic serine endoprotease DegP-like precursor [Botrimarina colliarenosi]
MTSRGRWPLGVFLCLLGPALAAASGGPSLEAAIDRAVNLTAPRVVQLRYFGAGGDALGAAAAPVTGYALDDHWVVTSTYALAETPAGILCRFADGRQKQAELVSRDVSRQVALLRLEGAGEATPTPPTGRDGLVGETAIALGRVYSADNVNLTVGVVSAVGRLGGRAVQTDALASPVNYGGPLVALDGVLLGVIVPLAPPGQSGVDLYDSGVGFAVPVESIAARLPRMAAGETIRSGLLGVTLPNEDPLREPPTLSAVTKAGPAASAGLQAGDMVLSLAGVATPTVWELRRVTSGLDAGDEVAVVVRRDADLPPRTLQLTLGEAPPEVAPEVQLPLIETKKPDEP